MRKPYFQSIDGAPAPLRVKVNRQVRFEELDPLNIVWHGHYASFFEDARVVLGDRYGIGYQDFMRHNIAAPVRRMNIDYHQPLAFQEVCTIEGILHWCPAARLNMEFIIRNAKDEITTTGCSVQMFVQPDGELMVVYPDFMQEMLRKWREGWLAEHE
jgi:acyl-CoA thioester hydrolase